MEDNSSNELGQLMQINEELLRSKGKLLHEIIELKKKLVAQDKHIALIGQLESQVNSLNAEIVEHLLSKSVLSAEAEELKLQLAAAKRENEKTRAELERVQQIKWFQRLLGRK